MKENRGLLYRERERLLSSSARSFMEATWALFAKRDAPHMPQAEAVAAFKELHAAGLVELVHDGDGVARGRRRRVAARGAKMRHRGIGTASFTFSVSPVIL